MPNRIISREAAFAALAESILRSPRAYSLAILILFAVSLVSGFPPKVEGDILRLIPASDPATRAMLNFREQPGGEGVVALSVPAGTNIADLAVKVQNLPTVRTTYYGLEGPTGLKIALLQFPATELERLAAEVQMVIESGGFGLVNLPELPGTSLPGTLYPLRDFFPDRVEGSRAAVLFVIPNESERDVRFSERLLSDLETAVPEGTMIAGPHAQNARDTRATRQDIVRTSIFSLILVMAIVGFAFGHTAGMLILIPPLLVANIVTHSILQVTVGAINMYTSMGSAVLLGLGIDFGIHLVSRYREELGKGLSPDAAVISAWVKTGPPCLTSALTSGAAFLSLLIADFNGLSQLGLMLAIGVVLNLLMMLLMLPLFVTHIKFRSLKVQEHAYTGLPRRPLLGLFLLTVTAVLALKAADLSFEYDLGAIRGEGQAWSELTPEQRVSKEIGYPPVILEVEDRTAEHQYFQHLVENSELPHVRAVVSLDSVLPVDQEARLKALEKLVLVANHPLREDLPAQLRDAMEKIAPLDTVRLTAQDLPPGLALLIGANEPRVMLLLQGNLHDLRESYALSRELDPHVNGAVNGFLIAASIYEMLSRDLPKVVVLAFISVLLILAVDLRKIWLIAIGALSLLLGFLWAAGSLVVFDIRINIINVVAIPMLLGIGIDVIVHLLHRVRSGDDVGRALRTTGMAVLLSTVTTISAFLSLTLADSRGLQSMGFVVLIGLTTVFMSAILVLVLMNPAQGNRTSFF